MLCPASLRNAPVKPRQGHYSQDATSVLMKALLAHRKQVPVASAKTAIPNSISAI